MIELVNISFKGIIIAIGFNFLAFLFFSMISFKLFISNSTVYLEKGITDLVFLTNKMVHHSSVAAYIIFAVIMGNMAEWYSPSGTIINSIISSLILILIHIALIRRDPIMFSKPMRIIIVFGTVPLALLGAWSLIYFT